VQCYPGLHGDHGQAVTDDIVHVTRDPEPFLVRVATALLLAYFSLALPTGAQQQGDRGGYDSDRHDGDQSPVQGWVEQAEVGLAPVPGHDHRYEQDQQRRPAAQWRYGGVGGGRTGLVGEQVRAACHRVHAKGRAKKDRPEHCTCGQVRADAHHRRDESRTRPYASRRDAQCEQDDCRQYPRRRINIGDYSARWSVSPVWLVEFRAAPDVKGGDPTGNGEDQTDGGVDDEGTPGLDPHGSSSISSVRSRSARSACGVSRH
jgi:hypothetical protein